MQLFCLFFYFFYIILELLAQNKNMKKWVQILLLICLGVFVGFVNGFLGAGGGMLLVPCIIPILSMDTKVAHATAILIILPICIVSGVIYALQGSFEFNVFLPCLIGTVVGGVLGTFILSKLKNDVITIIFSLVMVAAGVVMIVKAVM